MPAIRRGPRSLSRRGGFWLASCLVTTGVMGSYTVSPIYEVYQHRWHFSDLMVSVAFVCYAVGSVVSLLFFGSLSDRFGRRASLLFALAGVAISMVMLAFATGLVMLIVARCVQGVFTGIINGTGGAALTDLAARGDRRYAAFVHSASIAIGSAIGPLVAGVLVAHGPLPLASPYLLVLVLVVAGFVGVLAMPETVAANPQASLIRRLRLPDDRSEYLFGCTGTVICSASIALFAEFGTRLVAGVHLHGATFGGLIVFLLFAGIGLAQFGFRRSRPRHVLLWGALVTTLGWAGMAEALHSREAVVLVGATLIVGAGSGMAQMGGAATVAVVAATDRRGEAFSLFVAIGFIAIIAPGVGGGAVSGRLGLSGACWLMVLLILIVAAAAGALARMSARSASVDHLEAGRVGFCEVGGVATSVGD